MSPFLAVRRHFLDEYIGDRKAGLAESICLCLWDRDNTSPQKGGGGVQEATALETLDADAAPLAQMGWEHLDTVATQAPSQYLPRPRLANILLWEEPEIKFKAHCPFFHCLFL